MVTAVRICQALAQQSWIGCADVAGCAWGARRRRWQGSRIRLGAAKAGRGLKVCRNPKTAQNLEDQYVVDDVIIMTASTMKIVKLQSQDW